MKKLIPVLVTGILLVPTVAHATDTYGPGWSGDVWSSPTYTLPIHVVDSVIGTLRTDHRKAWRQARNAALTEWGLPFTVWKLDESALTHPFDGSAIEDMIIPDTILLVRNRTGAAQDVGGWIPETGGGIAVVSPVPNWFRWNIAGAVQVTAHELGHALGFCHGGNGIMWGGFKVNDEDRGLAAAYYQGG